MVMGAQARQTLAKLWPEAGRHLLSHPISAGCTAPGSDGEQAVWGLLEMGPFAHDKRKGASVDISKIPLSAVPSHHPKLHA